MLEHQSPQRERRPADWALIAQIVRGLQESPKHLSPAFFYDERGSQLFEQICTLPEYYLTRTETRILEAHASEITDCLGGAVLLVELGSGASTKTRRLLDRLRQPAAYVPVDISRKHLFAAARAIAGSYPHLQVLPVCADFTQPFDLPTPRAPISRVVVFFPGSTIGNFDPRDAAALLRVMRGIAGEGGGLLIGYDLVKDTGVLERAYNDSAGVTAEFNLNALVRLNREMGADFDLGRFRHEAVWLPAPASRMEMHLVSECAQEVTLGEATIAFRKGERLVTEHCHKYTLGSFTAMARAAGWESKALWTDERRYFNVHYFIQGPAPPHGR
jgi:dimethylhistidine N-methyltransferase